MQKLTLLLVVAALGVAGWQALEAANLRSDLQAQERDQNDLRGEVSRLSKEMGRLGGVESRPLIEMAATGPDGEPSDEPTLASRGASPAVIARAVHDLQGEVAALKTENEDLRQKVAGRPQTAWKRPSFLRDLDQAEKALDLTPGQKADMERVIAYAKRDLEDLWSIPNEDGKLFSEISKAQMTTVGEGITMTMPNFGAINQFKNSKIPGSNETYAQAERRIRERGRTEVRDILDPEQAKTFDDAHTDPLFGPQTGGAFSVITATSSSLEPDD